MRLKLLYPVALVVCVIVACGDSSTDSPSGAPDAGTLDATTSKPLPTTNPAPAKGDDDDDTTDDDHDDDDDDVTPPTDAGKDATPPKDAAPKDSGPPKYRVFVTKERFTGNLGGLAGADALCTTAATNANLGGPTTWKAWVSTTEKNAGERIIDRSPWFLIDKTTVAFQDFDGLKSPPLHRIDQNEMGTTSLQGTGPLTNRVWTGTTNGGVLVPGKNCSEWADDTQGKGVAGAYFESSGATNWTRYALQADEACDKKWPIYCFEQ